MTYRSDGEMIPEKSERDILIEYAVALKRYCIQTECLQCPFYCPVQDDQWITGKCSIDNFPKEWDIDYLE